MSARPALAAFVSLSVIVLVETGQLLNPTLPPHMQETFSAVPLDGSARVQLCVLRADDPSWRARAERHASLMAEVTAAHSSHVLPLLRVVRPPRGQDIALVSPHLSGGDLFDRLERFGPLPEPIARRITAQILAALGQLHALHIVHADLQPAAVLFESPHLDESTLRLGGTCRQKRPFPHISYSSHPPICFILPQNAPSALASSHLTSPRPAPPSRLASLASPRPAPPPPASQALCCASPGDRHALRAAGCQRERAIGEGGGRA